jgi:5S rRNA maturation endonuclease (ribonuclease M5)
MNTPDFILHLQSRGLSPRRSGTGWQARCAGHDDSNASLSISTGADGRILLKCHAGCSAENIVTALGLTLGDLFPPRAGNGNHSKPRIVAAYDYHDENGKLLFQCVRFEPKDFRQRRPDPAKPGEWIWNLKDTCRVLYRLREVKAAIADGRTIFVAEGEKDCDALVKHGFVATCNPMGAGKWLLEHTATLAGASRVVVIADKDTPGRNHAQAVAVALHGAVKSVKVIELPDVNTKTVKDAADWFAAGGTADALRGLVKAAPEIVPAVEPQPTKPGSAASDYLGAEFRQSEWTEPKPLPADLPAVPPFNFALLPDTFQDWIEDIAERMQCPPDFPAVGAMIAVGSLVGRKIGIRPKRYDDWLVVPNLFDFQLSRRQRCLAGSCGHKHRHSSGQGGASG